MPFFTYNRDVPDAPNNPSVDQPDMKTNTNNTDDLIAVDHFSFNVNTGGTHKKVTLTDAAAPAIPAGTSAIFHSNTVAGLSWPFWKNSAGDFQMMGANNPTAAQGFVFLPAGIMIQWGQGTTNGAGDATITFTPNFTTFFSASLTRIETGGNNRGFVQFTALPTGAGGSVKMRDNGGSGIAGSFLWIAIGKV